jgi:hypothetical protein
MSLRMYMTRRASRILDLPEGFMLESTVQVFDILAEYQSALCEKFPAVNSFCRNHAEPKIAICEFNEV